MSETAIPAAEITGGLPIGTIVAYYGEIDNNVPSTVPFGWLLCNNDSIPDGSEYNTLREFCKYAGHPGKVPDLRGMFLRGSSAGRTDEYADPEFSGRLGLGTIQKIGSYQHDAFQGHWHSTLNNNWNNTASNVSAVTAAGGTPMSYRNLSSTIVASDAIEELNSSGQPKGNGAPRTSSETRPKNVYVNYIIKAK